MSDSELDSILSSSSKPSAASLSSTGASSTPTPVNVTVNPIVPSGSRKRQTATTTSQQNAQSSSRTGSSGPNASHGSDPSSSLSSGGTSEFSTTTTSSSSSSMSPFSMSEPSGFNSGSGSGSGGGGGIGTSLVKFSPAEIFRMVSRYEFREAEIVVPNLGESVVNARDKTGMTLGTLLGSMCGSDPDHKAFPTLVALVRENQYFDINALVEPPNKKYLGKSLLDIAILNKNLELVKVLTEHPDIKLVHATPGSRGSTGITSLYLATAIKCDIEIAKALLQSNADEIGEGIACPDLTPLEQCKKMHRESTGKEEKARWRDMASLLEYYNANKNVDGWYPGITTSTSASASASSSSSSKSSRNRYSDNEKEEERETGSDEDEDEDEGEGGEDEEQNEEYEDRSDYSGRGRNKRGRSSSPPSKGKKRKLTGMSDYETMKKQILEDERNKNWLNGLLMGNGSSVTVEDLDSEAEQLRRRKVKVSLADLLGKRVPPPKMQPFRGQRTGVTMQKF